jgi:hypothetical protein
VNAASMGENQVWSTSATPRDTTLWQA